MKFKIIQYPNIKLASSTSLFDVKTTVDSTAIVTLNRLQWELKTACLSNNGVGIAAIQLGHPIQICWIKSTEYTGLVINPKFIPVTDQKSLDIEGCLSCGNRWFRVERFFDIEAEFLSYNKEKLTIIKTILTGMTARIFQHEFDHCRGICLPDFANEL